MSRFDGRVAFVTGAAHGQGRATALAFAREGARVAAFDVARPLDYPGYAMGSAGELASLRAECEALGSTCLTFQGDVRDGAAVAAAVEDTVARLGAVDVLFNNAGICAYGLAHELTEAEWDAMIDVNLKGAWVAARTAVKLPCYPA
jgi:NAD(P)-dependent dehydrogenase (short-subunit alcohol dehydrogenase family)